MTKKCPYCENDLIYQDFYGKYLGNNSWNIIGHIYKCKNEKCESEVFNFLFYDRSNIGEDSIREGYPC